MTPPWNAAAVIAPCAGVPVDCAGKGSGAIDAGCEVETCALAMPVTIGNRLTACAIGLVGGRWLATITPASRQATAAAALTCTQACGVTVSDRPGLLMM